jgi:ABC-type phosphate/phosphonate transport system substrate-binding protein
LGPSVKQRYLILVRSSDKDKPLADLRNQKLSIARGHLVAKRFLDVTLMQRGLPASDRFFSEADMDKNSNTAIIDLFFGRVDLVVIPEFGYELALELNPQLRHATTVLAKSEPLIHEIVGARFDFPKERLDRIRPHLVKLPSRRIQLLFEAFHVTGFHLAKGDALKEVRELDESYRVLIGRAQ